MDAFWASNRGQLEIARQYTDAGISVIPVRLDGTKRPAVPWKEYQSRLATDEELVEWFSRPAGIGLVAGIVSGGLEVLDFDEPAVFPAWCSLIPALLAEELPVIRTGSGGVQVYYRCEEVTGNHKIAMEPYTRVVVDPDGRHRREQGAEVRIETRGEGGFVVAVGSPAAVHPSGVAYRQESGVPLPDIPVVSLGERKALWAAARQFDVRPTAEDARAELVKQRVSEIRSLQGHHHHSDELTPWDWFNSTASWVDILGAAGWTSSDGVHWTRPGKAHGLSGVIRATDDGTEVLVCFSTSTGALSPRGCDQHRTLSKFIAWRDLCHGGDSKAAARAARLMMGGGR